MRRLTDPERDDAARWFGVVDRYRRNLSRRSPDLADALDDAAGIASMRAAINPHPSPTCAYLQLVGEARSVLRGDRRRRARLYAAWDRLRREHDPGDDDGPTPALDAVASLTPRQAEVVRLCVIGDASLSEAAHAMGLDMGNTGHHRSRALARIRAILESRPCPT